MKTEVIMKRNLFGSTISQKSKSEFFSATDLMKAGNRWRREKDYKLNYPTKIKINRNGQSPASS